MKPLRKWPKPIIACRGCLRIRKKKIVKNKFHPLPADYDELTTDGRKLARLSVLTDHSTPKSFALGFYFFRKWYLIPMEGYYKKFVKSPPFHYEMIADMKRYTKNLYGAPRGFAKSMTMGSDACLYLLYTKKHYDIAQCLCVHRMIPKTSSRIMTQVESNPYLGADFGVMKSSGRGGESWSKEYFKMLNGSSLEFFSTEARKRGARPDLFILDDPEYDTDKHETAIALLESFQARLFQQIIPMLRKGSRVFWIGTVINRRTSIYLAQSGDDERFKQWNIRILPACKIDENDNFTELLWPDEWNEKELKNRRAEIDKKGVANFAAEYLNAPTSGQARLLQYDVICNTYQVSSDVADSDFPLTASDKATVKYHILSEKSGKYEKTEEPYKKWINSLFRIVLVDFAYKVSMKNDFNVVATVGFCRKDILWLLDLWVARAIPTILHKEIIRQGVKWQAHVVAPESPPVQWRLAQDAAEAVQEVSEVTKWYPKVIPPMYPKDTTKAVRIIQALAWRFPGGRIKLPTGETYNTQPYEILRGQISDFTMDLALLTYDDAIDTLAMAAYVRRKSGVVPQDVEPVADTYEELLAKGHTKMPGTDIPLIYAVNINNLTNEQLHRMREHGISRDVEGRRSGRRRRRPVF